MVILNLEPLAYEGDCNTLRSGPPGVKILVKQVIFLSRAIHSGGFVAGSKIIRFYVQTFSQDYCFSEATRIWYLTMKGRRKF
jgi:hypothetical protein